MVTHHSASAASARLTAAGRFGLAIMTLGAAPLRAAVEPHRPPPPSAVTMYRDRAVVARRATVALAPGMNMLRYEKLPPNLQEVSLRARLHGDAPARIVNVTTWTDERREIQDEAVKTQDRRIATIDAALAKVEVGLPAATTQGYLDNYEAQLSGIISAGTLSVAPDTAGWHDALRIVADRRDKVGRTLASGQRRQREMNEERAEALAALRRLENPKPRAVRVVEVHIEAEAEASVDLEILYEMRNAGWEPVYDLREADDGTLELQYFAALQQHTDEDWKDVEVTLSTAEPATGGNRPRLGELIVSAEKRDTPNRGQAVFAAARAHTPLEVALHSGGETADMRVRREATSFAFELPGRLTIPRDGRLAKTRIAVAAIAEKTGLWTMPLQNRLVYRRLKATNPVPFPLLEGAIYTYHRGAFVGVGRMPFTPISGAFETTTGTDPEFHFVNVSDNVKRRQLMGAETRTHTYRAHIRNDKSVPIELTVAFAIPVSEIEEVKVTLDDDAFDHGPATNRDDKRGLIDWVMALDPGATASVAFVYRVTGPPDILNRRCEPNPQGDLNLLLRK